jgi:hypothetical protein
MCYFITVGVPDRFGEQARETLENGYVVSRSGNRSLAALFDGNPALFTVTSGICACDLYQAPVDHEKALARFKRKARKPKAKKRGWTKTKIDRAVKDRMSALARRKNGLSPSLRQALADLARQTDWLAIVVHWYSGGVDDEAIPVRRVSAIDADTLLTDDWAVIEDTLLTVTQ